MAKQRNRINLTLDDEMFDLITELSDLSDTPRASIINDFLQSVKPNIQMSVDLIKKIKANELDIAEAGKFFNEVVAQYNDVVAQAVKEFNEVSNDTDNRSGS